MSNPPPGGYGRGGRGAALAQLLSQQVRRPGDEGTPQPAAGFGSVPQQPAPAGSFGASTQQPPLGAASAGVQQLQQPAPGYGASGQSLPGATSSSTFPTPAASAAIQPPTQPMMAAPMAQAQRPALGRGAMLARLMQSQQSSPASSPSPMPPGGELQPTPVPTPELAGSRPQSSASQRPSVASPAPTSGPSPLPPSEPLGPGSMQGLAAAVPSAQPGSDGDAKRESYLERMLMRLNTEQAPVVNKGKAGNKVALSCNYIALRCRNKGVYQYAISFSPEVDSLYMRHKLIEDSSDVFGSTKSFDGRILFLPIQLQEAMIMGKMPTDGTPIKIFAKLVRVLPPESCLQLYNITFRKALSKLKMCQVGRDYYLPEGAVAIPQHKLEVWPGYITAIDEYEGGLLMLTDVKHRVLRTQTVLDLIYDCVNRSRSSFKEDSSKKLIGAVVLTRYNNRTYRVEDIAWDQSPKSPFTQDDGSSSTFVDYYKKHYNKEIKDLQQPLLISKLKKQEQRRQKGQAKPVADKMICLIPELCFMTGLTDDMRADFRVMKDLATHTRVPPAARRQSLRQLSISLNKNEAARAELDKWGLIIDEDIMKIEGRQLPPEKIVLGGNREVDGGVEADWGRDVTRSQVITPVNISNWLLLVESRNQAQTMEFVNMYQRCGRDMGIKVAQPMVCVLANDRTESYIKEIRDKLSPQCQLVVTIFPSSRDDRYNAVKKVCCVDMPVPSQVINFRTIGDMKKLRSVTQKIALQINCKLGGELWGVKIPTKSLMVVGIDTYHEAARKSNSVAGFVSSINETCTRWYSRVSCQNPHEELMNGLKPCFTAALRKYHEVNHSLPKWIFIFRDGVGDGQLRYTAEFEVPQLSECFHNFGADYNPKICVVVVQKRINQRIFRMQDNGGMDNPAPGTILDHTVTRRNWTDFFLISQHVRQGTVSPTHYVVVHDTTGLDIDRIQSISYKMTHLYYNWPGTVRVPAPCQYAHKLAYLVGQNIRREPSELLSDRLFFL